MLVTFVANAKVHKYRPGKIYTETLTPLLKALLDKDVHLSLIDPPTLEEPPVVDEKPPVIRRGNGKKPAKLEKD